MNNKYIGILIFFFLTFYISNASDIVYVGALNSRVIMIHFDDGYVRYHQKGEDRSNEWVISQTLDISEAVQPRNYEIKSDSGYYSQSQNPVKIDRKSKGTEFTWLCDNWSSTKGCVNGQDDHAKEHWIYLTLPEPLEMGKNYSVHTGDLAGNGNSWTIRFNLIENRSEAIHVNIIGYDPDAPQKYGYVYHWGGSAGSIDFSNYNGKPFYLIDTQSGDSAFSGTVRFRKSKLNKETYQSDTPNGNFLGADVYECNFSGFKATGEYVLAVDGIGCSFPFKIEQDIYRLPFYTSVRGLFHNRSGMALKQPYTEYERPAPHNPLETPGFAGQLQYTSSRFVDWNEENNSPLDKQAIENGILGPINTWGWYQDAGDWDGYFSHLKIPVMLMLTWEMAPEKFSDGGLNLPEGTNQIPDIVDEAAWLIRFFQRTRAEIIERGYGTGGVGSRVAPDWFGHARNGTPSYEDTGKWIISGEDPFTTYFYAGLAAHFQLILNKLDVTDPDSVDWKKEAIEAYSWAENNTRPNDLKPYEVHNYKLFEFKLYAAATLFRLTGEEKYLQEVQSLAGSIKTTTVMDENQKWGPYALMTMGERDFPDQDLIGKLKGAVIATAENRFNSINKRACRYGGNIYLPMLIGQATTPRVFEIMVGHFISREFAPSKTTAYLAGLYTTADYFLGCNPHNMAWITHVGVRYPQRLLHIDSWYNETGDMVPGITPYGPWRDDNSTGPIGPWSLKWPYKTLFPEGIDNWPGHERWYNNYTTPSNAEFTVHQNTVLSAIVYGYLCDEPDGSFDPNDKPVVEIKTPVKSTGAKGDVSIEVIVDDPDGKNDIAWVEFYNDWHKLGQSNKSPYTFTWKNPQYGEAKLVAKVVDKRGFSASSDTVRTEIIPQKYNVTIVTIDSITQEPVSDCLVEIEEIKINTNNQGEAYFEQISGLVNVRLENSKYHPKSISNISIYSDTTLTFIISQKKNEVVFIVYDQNSGATFEGVNVTFDGKNEVTNQNGEVFYTIYKGDYDYFVEKSSFANALGRVAVESDTTYYIFLQRTEAEIKFVLKEGTTPVNKATVILNADTLFSSALGIARFRNLFIPETFNYKIFKGGYQDVLGSVDLNTDTVINISMTSYPTEISGYARQGKLQIWPNPVKTILNVLASEPIYEIKVVNMAGTAVIKKQNIFSEEYAANIQNLQSGLYFLMASFSDGTLLIKKLVKE